MKKRKTYVCIISSNSSLGRGYEVNTSSAMKAADMFGRCEYGEDVSIYTKGGKIVSRAMYTPEEGGHYYLCYRW